jgi:hypothetical protein
MAIINAGHEALAIYIVICPGNNGVALPSWTVGAIKIKSTAESWERYDFVSRSCSLRSQPSDALIRLKAILTIKEYLVD